MFQRGDDRKTELALVPHCRVELGGAREVDRETLREAVRDMHFRCRFSFVELRCGWESFFRFPSAGP